MKALYRSVRRVRTLPAAAAVLGLCASAAALAGPPPPTAPSTTTGDYTVTPHGCNTPGGSMYCADLWLEEKIEPAGSWRSVGRNFVDKPPGLYSYRSADLYCDAWYGWCYTRYSTAVTVTVVDASSPPPEPLDRQLAYRYTVATGNVVGDWRTDLLIRRVSGPSNGNGVIDEIMLQQVSGGRFQAVVPSAAQAGSTVWRSSALNVAVEDMNADGYADVLVQNVASVISGAADTIVYASGNSYIQTPKGFRTVDGPLQQFSQNIQDYMLDNDYFHRQAPMAIRTWVYRFAYCPTLPGIDEYSMIYMLQCSDLTFVYYDTIPDYSGFNSDAVEIWQDEIAVASGDLAPSSAAERIADRIESVIGVEIGGWDMREIFGGGSGVTDPTERRGLDGFLAVIGIGNAQADEPNNENDGVPGPRNPDKIYIVARYLFGSSVNKLHTALLYHMPVTGVPTWYSGFDSNESALFDGTLIADTNNPKDAPLLMRLTIGEALPPGSESRFSYFFVNMLSAHNHYRGLPQHQLAQYDAVPEVPCGGCNGRNSNGYVHGLIRATNGQPSATPGFTLNGLTGWEYPVEPHYFGR